MYYILSYNQGYSIPVFKFIQCIDTAGQWLYARELQNETRQESLLMESVGFQFQ